MAYSNYGSFVYLNGKRRKDKEDVCLYHDNDVLLPKKEQDSWSDRLYHGVIGDGDVRLALYKESFGLWDKGKYIDIFSTINERTLERLEEDDSIIIGDNGEKYLDYEYSPFVVNYRGYIICFESKRTSDHYVAEMITPTGDRWQCIYGYAYGAGWTDSDEGETK